MIKIKVIVNAPPNAPFGYRHQTFFIKVPTSIHNGLLDICNETGKNFETVFIEAVTSGLARLKEKWSQE